MKLNRLLTIAVAIVLTLTLSCEDDFNDTQEPVQKAAQLKFVPGEILIKFKDGDKSSSRTKSSALSLIMGNVVEIITTNAMKTTSKSTNRGDLMLVTSKLGTMEAIALLKDLPEIEYAEPNWIYQHFDFPTSNDPYYVNGLLWGMYGDATAPANLFGSQAGEAWAAGHTGSTDVYVGVIDEGAQYSHEDLKANFWTNPFDPIDGTDNDGNGYKDDVHGWDFDKNDNSTYDGTQDDHGTHVSGTIGAVGGNGTGVAGVNWQVTIISAKFLGRRGGTTANAIKAVDYITDLKTRNGLNIVATNNSWGGGGFSQALQDAIERANRANILFCAAAGNGGSDGVGDDNDKTANYPSNYPNTNVIAVASITSTGARSLWSNYGATTVDIGAPGSGIYSTLPNGYGSYSGTSMATPHVTGACALYASTHPGASAATIKDAILRSTVSTASLSNKCVTGGRLNVSGF
ncbi:S8 family peptidase [Flavobacterium gawalongense]|uniref:S8 family serine peptidase n=1 Tax=Flavobacterium gawalongense TaxID=2594432 RepID=A0A553BL48_9FLAO|nr:S8 family peptidase [Flavobacterium gawalongense]TRX00410.1 S8 family serine peptidase [Flavobacterium gawalongense]TRX05043.1 S8 family serine peptidase [Flavobacterium gawalongense]TRX08961.1 S8 family serine peptidase [Flavobacterium gawalongense]TRX10052.1 S8 family serine peptidase [Flavobacterium gawalongense]TRX26915.1 S8 family serine peptidase [Flavobacterium gawalongense]